MYNSLAASSVYVPDDRALRTIDDIEAFERYPLAARNLPKNTYEALRRSAARTPEAPALSFFLDANDYARPHTWTYRELLGDITRAANAFGALGVGPKDVIAYVLPNLPETHFAIWGGEAAGIVLAINPLLEGEQIANLLEAAGATVLVTLPPTPGTDIWSKLAPQLDKLPGIRTVVWTSLAPYVGGAKGLALKAFSTFQWLEIKQRRVVELRKLMQDQPSDRLVYRTSISSDDHSSYLCTGGTTGLPKIAARTHRNEVFDAWMMGRLLPSWGGEQKTVFCGLPLFHANAQVVTGLAMWMLGGHVVLGTPQGYRGAGMVERFWEIAAHYRLNYFSGVPTLYTALLNQPRDGHDLSSLEYGFCGAAPMPTDLFERFEHETGLKILEAYGLTEAVCVSSCNPALGERRVGSVGLRLPYQDMRAVILDDDGNYLRDAETDEAGVIAMRGPNVFAGYLDKIHNRSAWIEIDGDRWLNSGDLGRQDADGYFWLTGRKKELIIRGGHNIDPKLIEEPLYGHPDVALAAAIGSPDPYSGEIPVAYVELRPNRTVTPEALREFLEQRVTERAAVPKRVVILDRMPTTAVGKIFKPALQQLEIEHVIRTEAKRVGAALSELSVDQCPRRGLVARVRASTEEPAFAEALGQYAFAVDWA